MSVYLLSKNKLYSQYWNGIVIDSIIISDENTMDLDKSDLIIISFDLYDVTMQTDAKIIVLDNEPTFEKCMFLIKNGVKAYGNTYMHSSHILSAIESLKSDKIWMYPDFISTMIGMGEKSDGDTLEEKLTPLTKREKEISKLILNGLTNKEIAIELSISPNTVKIHTKNIYTKLGVLDRLSLYALLK